MATTNVTLPPWKGGVGDRCLIIKSSHPENLGLIVRALQPSAPPGVGFMWFCRAEVSAILSADQAGIARPVMNGWLMLACFPSGEQARR
jgi:hypothetical protein